jgi:hypothetical protein
MDRMCYELHEYLNNLIPRLRYPSGLFSHYFVVAAVVVQLECKHIQVLDDGNSHRMDVRHRISIFALQAD